MKNKSVKLVLLGFIISSLFACNTNNDTKTEKTATEAGTGTESKSGAVDKEKIKQEIQAKEDQFAEVYNSGEVKNIGYYADDAVTFYPNRPPLVGKAAIVDFLITDIRTNSNKLIFNTNEVFVSSDGNQVVELGTYRLVDSSKTTINTGNYMSLFEKRDGKYVCVRDMSASILPIE